MTREQAVEVVKEALQIALASSMQIAAGEISQENKLEDHPKAPTEGRLVRALNAHFWAYAMAVDAINSGKVYGIED